MEERLAVEKKLGSGHPAPEERGPEAENEEGDLDGDGDGEEPDDLDDDDETVSGGGPTTANVDQAIMALKAQKEKAIGKKLQKKMKAQAKRTGKKPGAKASSSKAGADASAGDAQDSGKTLDLQECAEFSISILPLKSTSGSKESQRIKHCLDDFITSLHFCRRNLAIQISDEEAERSKRFLISLFLELSWGTQVAINGKAFKVYSQFRDEAHKVFYAAHQRLRIGQAEYDPLQLAKDLMSAVTAPVSCLIISGCG